MSLKKSLANAKRKNSLPKVQRITQSTTAAVPLSSPIIDCDIKNSIENAAGGVEVSYVRGVKTNSEEGVDEVEVENSGYYRKPTNKSLPYNSDYDMEEIPKWYDYDTYDTFQECLEAADAYYENELLDQVNSYDGINAEDLPDDFVSVGRNALETSSDNDASDMVETTVENGIDIEDDNDFDIYPDDIHNGFDEDQINDVDDDYEDEDSDLDLFDFE